jgi:hypothetical protein
LQGLLVAAFFGVGVPDAAAQDTRLEQLQRQFESIGVDKATFTRQYGRVLAAPPRAAAASETPGELANQVSEIRVFMTDDPNVVVGEIAIAGKTRLKELQVPLGNETVRFTAARSAADRAQGETVFTARFKFDTNATFENMRKDLRASASAVRGDGAVLVRRGPRDIVPMKEALAVWQKQTPKAFATVRAGNERTARLIEARDAASAARELNIDIARIPLFTLPGPAFDPSARLRVPHFFDVPVFTPFPPPAPPVSIDAARSLMVVEPTVVDDPGRTFDSCTGAGTAGSPWSFGHLMREMANGTGLTPEDFVLQWLSSWQIPQEANGFIVDEPSRGAQLQSRVINSWQALSPGGTFNVDFFPARLLAIVNRPDLADKIGYGTAGSAGEGRLVFGLIERSAPGSCNSLPFTVIFEFGIKGGSCTAVKSWHQRWKDLDALALGSPAYNAALELITRDFTDHGSNPAQLPNMSSLNQLRTNEIALGSPWQLREFRLQGVGSSVPPGLLDLVTVKQTPDLSLNNTPTLLAYLTASEADILADKHVVPGRFPGVLDRFLGAKSDTPSPSFFWSHPTPSTLADPAETRRKFSLNTCNGCHAGETGTFFTHIGSVGTRSPGSPAALSGFLTGITMTVPVTGGSHTYNDLAERQAKMSDILTNSCFGLLGTRRLPFVH